MLDIKQYLNYTVTMKYMEPMNEQDIIEFLKSQIEPLEDDAYGNCYRASVYLVDGIYLPCVVFRNTKTIIELAKKRFDEEREADDYDELIKSFVARGNSINFHQIAKVEKSNYAFPRSIVYKIMGETTMAWTAFAAKMKDGKYIGFGTSFNREFFEMPDNYSVDDIVKIINNSYVLPNGKLRPLKEMFIEPPDDYKDAITYRERVFFVCFIDKL